MKKIIITVTAIVMSISLFAQNNIEDVLTAVEQNNKSLKALRDLTESQKLENKTGIFLDDPEIGFNYLWGHPSEVGKRHDITVTQSFDFSTILGYKKRVANEQNTLLEWQYKAERMALLLEAQQLCLDIIYNNALLRELNIRKEHATLIAQGQERALRAGESNMLEFNNAQLNQTTVLAEISRVETERQALLAQLAGLNGGEQIEVGSDQFTSVQLPTSFDNWFVMAEEKNPILAYVRQEVELAQKDVALHKSMWLPTLSAGYMSENVVGERYNGITMGMSVPLWSNKNRVKQAKTAVVAAESKQADVKQQFISQLQTLYIRVDGLKKTADIYRASLANANNSVLLKKALDAGEISLLDYVVEMGLYYNTVNQVLQSELEYQKAFAELLSFEL